MRKMSASTKLSTSVKAICYLAQHPDQMENSGQIAEHIGVNPSKLRQLISLLVKNNILSAYRGKEGGIRLARQADQIHLQEVYCAIEDRKAFHLHVNRTEADQLSESAKINNYFLDLFAEVQVEIEDKMKKITIQSIIDNTL